MAHLQTLNRLYQSRRSAAVEPRMSCALAALLVSAILGAFPAFGQFVDYSSYTSPTTPVSWNTPRGNIEVTFSVPINTDAAGLIVRPDAVGQFSEWLPPDNPAFTSRYPMASYQNLNVSDINGPGTDLVTETLVFQYSQPVNFANDLIFLDIGGFNAQFDGPFIGTITASLGGVPVSTSTWQFTAFDDISPIDPVSFSWDASAGQFQVDQYIDSIAGILSSDPDTPFDTLTITYQTCFWDVYGIAQYAYPISRAVFTYATLNNGNVILGGTNGTALASYRVLTSTNIALSLTNWTAIVTNSFDTNGNFSITNAVNPTQQAQFYRLSVP